MNTLYVRCQTKDYILDIVAARAGMRINKVNSVNIVHILVWTYLFLLTSFFDCLSFCGLFLKHPYKRFFPFYIRYFYQSRFLSHHGATCVEVTPPC